MDAVAAVILFCFIAVCQGQLSLVTLPDVLFVDNNGVHNIELGTVVQAHCIANSSSVPVVRWLKNGGGLLSNDPPHMRIRTSTDGTVVTSVLTIDNYGLADDGNYTCEATDGTTTMSSTTLSLDGINDDSIELLRNPVDFEIIGGTFSVKPYDSIRDNRTLYTPGEDFETDDVDDLCCQVFRCIVTIPGDQISASDIDLLTVTWLKDGEEVVPSADRIVIINQLRYPGDPDSTRYISRLFLEPFETSDAGVYQCVYSDFDSERELVFSSPFRLDSDDTAVGLEAISAVDIVLDPPEKLIIEVESSGAYFRHAWFKNDEELYPNENPLFGENHPERFSEFFQVFVQDSTTTSDHGIYRVDLIDDTIPTPEVLQTQEFTVTPLVTLRVDALNTAITVVEGDDVNISCIASANPLPPDIVWTFDGISTSFTQSDTIENMVAYIPSEGKFAFSEGNITSTLHILAAEYPTNNGVYTCSSSTGTTTLNDTITVHVQASPKVGVSATSTGVILGQSVNITCNVSRSIPTDYAIEWTLTRVANDNVTTLTEDGETLMLTDITEDELGAYTCTAANSANLSGSANITIEERGAPEVTIADVVPALPGDNVTLNCSTTGDTPLTYQWTMQGSSDILNSDTSDGILELIDIQENQFGTYICTISNDLGVGENNVTIEQAIAPVIDIPPVDTVVVSPETAMFFCEVSGVQNPKITWRKNGITLEPEGDIVIARDTGKTTGNSTLRILNAQPNDAAIYTCVAITVAGNTTASGELTVKFPPEITAPPLETEITVNEGMTAIYMCTATGVPGPNITWSRVEDSSNSSELNEEVDPRVSLGVPTTPSPVFTPNGTIFSVTRRLTLSNTTDSDSEFYLCHASNGEEPTLTAILPFQLFVRVAPVIIVVPEDSTELQGDTAMFTCNATARPRPNITWWRNSPDGTVIQISSEMDKITIESEPFGLERDQTSTLTVLDVQPSDAGMYRCRADNEAGRAEVTATLTVHVLPDIIFPPPSYRYEINQFTNVFLECNVTGIPPPDIHFFLNDDSTFNDHYSLLDPITETIDISGQGDVVYLVTRQLSISPALDEDSNNYTCVATSENANDSVVFELIVMVAPNVTDGPDNQAVLENENVLLSCVAEGRPPPTITWFKRSTDQIVTDVQQSEGVSIVTQSRGARQVVSNLTIESVQPRDAADYLCNATNVAGSDVQAASLSVHVLPEIRFLQPPMLTINQSDTATFECNATGIPAPVIQWFMNTKEVVVTGTEEIMLNPDQLTSRIDISELELSDYLTPGGYVSSVTSILTISPTLSTDSGNYSCIASNVVGRTMTPAQDEDTATLYIQVMPKVAIVDVDLAIPGDNVTLNCSATGDTPLTYQWTMQGSSGILNSDTSDGILELMDIQERQFGTYICTVSNALGVGVSNVTIEQATAPVAGDNENLTFRVGYDLVLRASFTNFNLVLDDITWIQNPSISLMDGVGGVYITSSDLSAPEATSTLTRPNIAGVSYAGTYVATASNRAGSSSTTFTVEITVQSALFQLRFVGISDCVQWREIQPGEKKDTIINSMTRTVEELCRCGFSQEAFQDIDVTAGFQCFDASPSAVTFRAVIMDLPLASSSQLISYIEEWVATQPSIVVLSSRLSIDSSCAVEIDNFNAPECNDMTPSTSDGNNNTNTNPNSVAGPVIGGVVGGICVLLLAIVALVLVVIFVRNCQKKSTYKLNVHKEDIDIYETIPDPPTFQLEPMHTTIANRPLPIVTEDNPSYGPSTFQMEPIAASKQMDITTGDNPSYATHSTEGCTPVASDHPIPHVNDEEYQNVGDYETP